MPMSNNIILKALKGMGGSLVSASVLCFLLCLPLGCAIREQKPTVGFAQMENNSPFRIAETNSMKAEGRERTDRFRL